MNINMIVNRAELTPSRAHPTDAGSDLKSSNEVVVKAHSKTTINTGVKLEIPKSYYGLVNIRSGFGTKFGLRMANTVGIIDSDYRGEILVILQNDTDFDVTIEENERFAQLLILPDIYPKFVPVKKLTETKRGSGGFGHTGAK